MYKLIIVLVLIAMSLFPIKVNAQEITDPNLPIVRCAGVSCTDQLYFFTHKVYMPMIGGN